MIELAHGVGRVYESPIPLGLYLFGAMATVAASFVVRAMSSWLPSRGTERRLAGPGAARATGIALKIAAVAGLTVTLVAGMIARSEGFTLTTLLFWVGWVVGMVVASGFLGGAWDLADPWTTLESVYRIDDAPAASRRPPPWIAPGGLYLLFWFELVSGAGFDDVAIVVALVAYTLVTFWCRGLFGSGWKDADPIATLFGFAARIAPVKLRRDGLYGVNPVDGIDDPTPMSAAAFVSIFVILGATTMDNISETVGWTSFLKTTGLESLPSLAVDSAFLALFGAVFLIPFLAAVTVSRLGGDRMTVARRFGWSLIPIGLAYILAHNFALVLTGVPVVVRSLSDPFERGWNLFGTGELFEGYVASPALVWFAEIVLIVGGHILGVLGAHRVAVRIAGDHASAVRSQYALTVLMSIYTVTTLWLLAQPLVA